MSQEEFVISQSTEVEPQIALAGDQGRPKRVVMVIAGEIVGDNNRYVRIPPLPCRHIHR